MIFLESQKLYDIGEMFQAEGVPEGYYEIDLSQPSVKRVGTDLTIVTLGPALYTAVNAADELAERFGVSAEIVDLRSANPLDYDLLVASVRKTGKVLLGLRGGRARQRHANGGRQTSPGYASTSSTALRRSWGRGTGSRPRPSRKLCSFPSPPGCSRGARRVTAIARLPAHDQPDHGRADAPGTPGDSIAPGHAGPADGERVLA